MPTFQQHVAQWKHNRNFAKSIDGKYRDWQITAIFYTALHAIDAALVGLGVDVADHTGRNEHVRTNASFASVRKPYLDLYRISRITRYDADPDLWIPKEYLGVAEMAEGLLKPIENGVEALTKSAIKYRPITLPV